MANKYIYSACIVHLEHKSMYAFTSETQLSDVQTEDLDDTTLMFVVLCVIFYFFNLFMDFSS